MLNFVCFQINIQADQYQANLYINLTNLKTSLFSLLLVIIHH